MQTLDLMLTNTAILLLVGSFFYFPLMFVLFVIRTENQKEQDARIANLEARVKQIQEAQTQQQITPAIEATEVELVASLTEAADQIVNTENESTLEQHIEAISDPTPEMEPVEITSSDRNQEISSTIQYAAAEIGQPFSIMIPTTDAMAADNQPHALPTIETASLTIRRGRNQEKLVTIKSIPFPLPHHIQRRKWRNTPVVKLLDLQKIANLT